MFNKSDKYGFEEDRKSAYFLSEGKGRKNKINQSISPNKDAGNKPNRSSSREKSRKKQMMLGSDPIRVDKVRDAKIKKQRGDYNSKEVYRKIADRLMVLFGIK